MTPIWMHACLQHIHVCMLFWFHSKSVHVNSIPLNVPHDMVIIIVLPMAHGDLDDVMQDDQSLCGRQGIMICFTESQRSLLELPCAVKIMPKASAQAAAIDLACACN